MGMQTIDWTIKRKILHLLSIQYFADEINMTRSGIHWRFVAVGIRSRQFLDHVHVFCGVVLKIFYLYIQNSSFCEIAIPFIVKKMKTLNKAATK